jgi:hypothetical protein
LKEAIARMSKALMENCTSKFPIRTPYTIPLKKRKAGGADNLPTKLSGGSDYLYAQNNYENTLPIKNLSEKEPIHKLPLPSSIPNNGRHYNTCLAQIFLATVLSA